MALAMALVCALANNPEVQQKAQGELDTDIGSDRLPRVEHRPTLPYLNALMKELMRWYNPAPLGEKSKQPVPLLMR
jgi:cytochrome P450